MSEPARADPGERAAAAPAGRRAAGRGIPSGAARIGGRAEYLAVVLERALPQLGRAARGTPGGDAAEWLLDNTHLLAEAIEQLRTGLPRGFLRELQEPGSRTARGVPRIYEQAASLLEEDGGRFDVDGARALLSAGPFESPLTTAELWALPLMLRLVALERLAATAAALAGVEAFRDRRSARLWPTPPDGVPPEEVGGYVEGLRLVATVDWTAFFEDTSAVEGVLRQEPEGVYARLDFPTRDAYRKCVEQVAHWGRWGEVAVARAALELAAAAPEGARQRHVGYYLTDPGRRSLEARLGVRPPLPVRALRAALDHGLVLYLGSVLAVTAALLAVLLVPLLPHSSALFLALALAVGVVPAHSLAVEVVNWVLTNALPPRVLPKLEFAEGIPADCRTAVVSPVLVASEDEADEVLAQVELNFHGNADPEIRYCVLAALPDAPAREMPGDGLILARLEAGIEALNGRYAEGSPRFLLLAVERTWNPAQRCWMGRERKRGVLEEFNGLLLGRPSALSVRAGDPESLDGTRYVVTLDADTRLPSTAARRLVATLAHPLNRPEADAEGRVVAGYTVLQPRLEVLPTATTRTAFARIYSEDSGLDLYSHAVSDVYQDLFGEGSYAGKGAYDVAAFDRSLEGAVPENALLSHDLFEGVHGRAALVSDIVLFEDYPDHFLTYMRRLHRWIRGDWQLLPWLRNRVPAAAGTRRNRLSALGRWKLLDNLRRSLLAGSLLLLILAGWLVLPGPRWWWTMAAVGPLAAPVVLSAATSVRTQGLGRRGFVRLRGPDAFARGIARWALALAFLPYRAWVEADAILRTLVRLLVTRRNLLEWTSAAHAGRAMRGRGGLGRVARQMWPAAAVAVGSLGAVTLLRPVELPYAAPLLAAWLLSPLIAWRVSRPRVPAVEHLPPAEARPLRLLARRTWAFFETFVAPVDQWLPPDNHQEGSVHATARRTSPTNVGFAVLSTLTAYDLGFLAAGGLAARLSNTFESIGRLERYRGHLLNWYETSTLRPLEPRYVSTVDSGNFAGALLAVAAGCREAMDDALPRVSAEGLGDTLAALEGAMQPLRASGSGALEPMRATLAGIRREMERVGREPRAWARFLTALSDERLPAFERELTDALGGQIRDVAPAAVAALRDWIGRFHEHLEAAREETETLLPWLAWAPPFPLPALPSRPSLAALPEICERLAGSLEGLARADGGGDAAAREARLAWAATARTQASEAGARASLILAELASVAAQAERLVDEMDFAFLFDPRRHLFHIGYDATAGRLDRTHYDLLASEARLASLIAIAKGDVPERHWLHMARPFRRAAGVPVLLSWGGSMFEYRLPDVLLRSPTYSLLHMADASALRVQQRFARRYGIPWGISESAYAELDAHGTYQYRSFGVPGLALRRDAGQRLVVAPYASALAVEIAPREAAENLARLARLGAVGRYGLYEAVDFGPASRAARHTPRLVRCYMAHHQGMLLVALGNLLAGGRMRARFHSDPRIAAVELLLHEQVPGHAHAEPRLPVAALRPRPRPAAEVRLPKALVPIRSWPQVRVLSNGELSSLVTARGGGGLRWRGTALTPWLADAAAEPRGLWIYLQDLDTGRTWSAAEAPTHAPTERQDVELGLEAAAFRCWNHGIRSTLDVTVAPDRPVEIRRLRVANETAVARRVRVTSYGEVALAPVQEYRRHPAFAKLFVESELLPEASVLLFHRRASRPDDETLWLAHGALVHPDVARCVGHETDRARFLGRLRTPRDPEGLADRSASAAVGGGSSLDPIFALPYEAELDAGQEVEIAFLTAAGASRAEALANLEAYRTRGRVEAAFDRARARAKRELRELHLRQEEAELLGPLLSSIVYPFRAGAAAAARSSGKAVRPALWSLGISGDLPLIVLRVRGTEAARSEVDALVRMQAYWRRAGVRTDLLILDEAESSYDDPLQPHLHRAMEEVGGLQWLGQAGGVHPVPAGRLDADQHAAVLAAASLLLDGGAGSLADQIAATAWRPEPLPPFEPVASARLETAPTPALPPPRGRLFDNGLGGFSEDGGSYVIHLRPGERTPAPWSNVVASPEFGFLATEAGLGFTWSANSGEHRLTPWSNDPVVDPPGEVLYLRDEETAEVWTPTPAPAPAATSYEVRHAPGSTRWRHASHGLHQEVLASIAPDEPVKIVRVLLRNLRPRQRRITLTYYAEWVLGPHRRTMAPYVVTEFDDELQAVLATQRFSEEFGGRVAFLASSERAHGATGDRIEFVGAGGSLARPAALERMGLAMTFGAALDPCGALQVHVDLAPDAEHVVHFLLGDGVDRDAARARVRRFRDRGRAETGIAAEHGAWEAHVRPLQVRTPDPALDLLVNRWLPYQALSCRLWGRSGFYQSSGAYGFRDQLQDVTSLFLLRPELARAQILEAARHQFPEGDVLHWWHPHTGAGVRTRCSDDLLWLPYVTAAYVEATGDRAILDEPVAFLSGDPLGEDERERYTTFPPSGLHGSLLDHCLRAARRGSTRGPHGLPLIGTGDWNDAMDRVGVEGRGESVWLAWFLHATLEATARLCDARPEAGEAATLRALARGYAAAAEAAGWDGAWYRRAYFDDGTPLGSSAARECRIDSLSQSWAVLSGAADPDRAARALASARERLVRDRDRLILLLDPPFDRSRPSPGYIRAYPPGVRENGGQYSHAAVWLAWAFAMGGDGDEAGHLLELLNPVLRSAERDGAERFRVEPYVLPADVYGVPPHVGRGGWTWYTGSAGWMYRLAVEAVLGIRLLDGRIHLDPCIPRAWPGFDAVVRLRSATYRIRVQNPSGVARGVRSVTCDGEPLPSPALPDADDGREHEVVVELGAGRRDGRSIAVAGA